MSHKGFHEQAVYQEVFSWQILKNRIIRAVIVGVESRVEEKIRFTALSFVNIKLTSYSTFCWNMETMIIQNLS